MTPRDPRPDELAGPTDGPGRRLIRENAVFLVLVAVSLAAGLVAAGYRYASSLTYTTMVYPDGTPCIQDVYGLPGDTCVATTQIRSIAAADVELFGLVAVATFILLVFLAVAARTLRRT